MKFEEINTQMEAGTEVKNIYLADDDLDDCMLFREAILELSVKTKLTISNDGNQLMTTLDKTVPPTPHVIFLDLNMPLKNGFECLSEIRQTEKLKNIPVVILSTTSNTDIIDKTYLLGANCYVTKPSSYALLIKVIETALFAALMQKNKQPNRDKFCLSVN